MHGLGTIYLVQGRYDQSEPLLTNTCDILCRILSKENWATLSVKNTLGDLYMAQGHDVKAEKLYLETREARHRRLGRNHPSTLETMNDLAVMYKKQGRYDEAEKLLLESLEGRRLKLGDQHPHTQESQKNLIELYEAWGKPPLSQTEAKEILKYSSLRRGSTFCLRTLPIFQALCYSYLLSRTPPKVQLIDRPYLSSFAYGIHVVPVRLNRYTEPELSPLSSL